MRFKRLELFGFKSFATKTAVQFEPGVTAIVGPNGSGKSNIVDAVRWVLGEHNPRDVRAPRLEDIIFNGTDSKAPLSMAEVSLTIENDQGLLPIAFTEVLVTRRIYRSGESECFINQSPCRLKDIQELFLGTGLGSGTYAIITQGHIDMVLSSKPEERRVVFEEASGVAKYLAKKQEATRRLDEVEQHLVRIVDIISEVRRQLSALERQANKARQYKTQWEQLKAWELQLAADELRHGEQLKQQISQQLEEFKGRRQSLDEERQRMLGSLDAWNTQIASTHGTLQNLRARVVESASRIEQHTEQRALKTRWVEELAAQRQQLDRELIQLQERLALLAGQLERFDAERAALDNQQRELASRLEETQTALRSSDDQYAACQRALEAEKAHVFEVASEAAQCRNALTAMAARIQSLDAQQGRAQAQQQSVQKRLRTTQERLTQAQPERAALGEQEWVLQEHVTSTRRLAAQSQAERDELAGRLRQEREHLLQEQATVKFLEEMASQDAGFPDGVKALMAAKPDGVIGVLADLVDAQPGYEPALEAALGELTMAIVVRDREALQRCQALLAAQQIEGVRFVVLADCPALSSAGPVIASGEAFLGTLKSLMRYDPTYERLVDWLLGQWAVIDEIRRLLAGFSPGLWVSKPGDRWDGRSWKFSGAAQRSTRVGLSRRLEQARRDVESLTRSTESLQAAWQQAEAQCQSLAVQESSFREQLEHLVPRRAKLDAQVSHLSHEIAEMEEELKALELDVASINEQRREALECQQQARDAAAAADSTQREGEAVLQDTQRRLEEIAQRRQQDVVDVTQLQTAIASLATERERTTARIDEIRSEQAQVATQHDAKRTQAAGVVARVEELTAQRQEHETLIATLTAEQAVLQTELDQVSGRLAEEERLRNQVLPSLLAAEQQLASVAQAMEEQERQLAERAFRRARIVERLREVYHIEEVSLAAEEQSVTEMAPEDRQALTEQVEKLKAKVETLGAVSLGSVEEYDELAKRLEFLKTQQEDTVKSRDDLRETITQINKAARTQFRDTFALIRQEFQAYFTKLFNGGQADLMLLDEDNVLDSGIEIVARPPGKRLQSISLLSGGERAITAVALLFALFKVRPSPFCVLDEIDAPLDEANVDRFTKVLEEFLSLSQFILITHNKKTITKADCLYGVTMEQPGVSKLVSVKLKTKKALTAVVETPAAAPAEPAPEAAVPA